MTPLMALMRFCARCGMNPFEHVDRFSEGERAVAIAFELAMMRREQRR